MKLKKGFKAEARKGASPGRQQREKIGPEVLEGMDWPMWHKVRVVHQFTRETKAGNDQLCIGFELTGSSAEGYVVWQNFNIDFKTKPDFEAREWERVGEVFAAAGLTDKSDTRELVGVGLEMYCEVPKNTDFQPLEGTAWRPWQNEGDVDYVPPPPKPPPRQVEPTGSHRYTPDPEPGRDYEPEPKDSKTEWSPPREPVQDEPIGKDPDDEIPF